jgi:hypothetical protein
MVSGIALYLGIFALILLASKLRHKFMFCDYAFILIALIGMAAVYGMYSIGIAVISLFVFLGLGYVINGNWRKNKIKYRGNYYNVHNCYNCGYNHAKIDEVNENGHVTFRCTRCGYTRSALFEGKE